MGKLSEIYSGWKNIMFQTPKVEKIAKKRMEICIGCPMLSKRNICDLCGCYMPAKVRSTKSFCVAKKW